MSDEDLENTLQSIKTQRNFSRLSVQILEVALQRVDGFISSALDGYQEHVPEPEPNPQRFTGYIKYDKGGYVKAYEEIKPLRDLSRLIRTFLPSMRAMSDCLQTQYQLLIGQHEIRALRRRINAHLNIADRPNPLPEAVPENPVVEANENENEPANNDDEVPPLENVEPMNEENWNCREY